MLKHCQSRTGLVASPAHSSSLASLSLSSCHSGSEVSFDSSFGSGGSCAVSPVCHEMSGRSSLSNTSSDATTSLSSCPPDRVTLKIFASCLRPDIEYKTLSVSYQSRSRELIWQLLGKFKMKHRDPKLFYLTMEVVISAGETPVTRSLVLDEEARPAELASCNPWQGGCKFTLQTKPGGLVRVYDSVLMHESQYKSLLISEETTVEEVVRILFHCYGLEQYNVAKFCLYEHCKTQNYERKLNCDDRPLAVQDSWLDPQQFRLVLRRAPAPPRAPAPARLTSGSIHQLGLPAVPVHTHHMRDMGAVALQQNLIERYSKFCQKYESYFYV